MDVINIENLTKYYGKKRGIIDLSLKIKEGEIFGFIGPNGSGKSTTIRIIMNLIKATKGKVEVFGKDIINNEFEIKKEIGYLPSEINFYEDMKVIDLINYAQSFYKRDFTDRINKLIEYFQLEKDKKCGDLSLGNKKKVGIIIAFLHEPKLAILDEPTSGLDPLMQNKFFQFLKEQNKKGTTIFFSSHILSDVEKLCDRVAIIKEGKLIKIESIESITKNRCKKVIIDFKQKKEIEKFTVEIIKEKIIKGNTLEFLFDGKIKDLINSLQGLDIQNLTIKEPSLEEIFIHYYS